MSILQTIKDKKLVTVIRNLKPKQVMSVVETLLDAGINIFEVTAESPSFEHSIESIKREFQDEAIVGVGTILDSETAINAVSAGAEFLVSPHLNVEMIKVANRYGIVSMPGAMTPTEILAAFEYGGDIIKVFPGSVLGPGYIKDIKGPLPHIPLMPTGGVNLENMDEFINNGVVAVGLGGAIVKSNKPVDKDELQNIHNRAAKYVARMQEILS